MGGRAQHIASAAQGVNHRRTIGVDLLTEIGNVELDDVRLAAEVVVPHPIQDLCLAEHPAWVAHQIPQQLELSSGQLDLHAGATHFVAVLVQCEIANHQGRVASGQRSATSPSRARTGDDLLQAERFGDVIVATCSEPTDPIFD